MKELRDEALAAFSTLTGLPLLAGIEQHGREPETARYVLRFADGRTVRIGRVDILFSRAKLNQVLAVAIQRTAEPCKPAEWADAVAAIVRHVVDVIERPGERFEDSVTDWLQSYVAHAGTDIESAAPMEAPFIADGHMHVHAGNFALFIRREYVERVDLSDLRRALVDLGYERSTVYYTHAKKRNSKSYYRYTANGNSPTNEPPK